MSHKTYVFEHVNNPLSRFPVEGCESSYAAVQALRTLCTSIVGWRLVKIVETTECDRSIIRIESDYKAMRPKYRRDK